MRAVAVGLTAALAALLIKKSNAEYALVLSLAGGFVILLAVLELMGSVTQISERLTAMSGVSPTVFTPLIKCVAIGVVTRVGADACKDSANGFLATSVELAGTVAALVAALPLVENFLSVMEGLL